LPSPTLIGGESEPEDHQLLPLIEVQDAKRPTTTLQQVGYSEVLRVRQAGKSIACGADLFVDDLCVFWVASICR
jgi:hypothetical protein